MKFVFRGFCAFVGFNSYFDLNNILMDQGSSLHWIPKDVHYVNTNIFGLYSAHYTIIHTGAIIIV
jgi:hypothetical protein